MIVEEPNFKNLRLGWSCVRERWFSPKFDLFRKHVLLSKCVWNVNVDFEWALFLIQILYICDVFKNVKYIYVSSSAAKRHKNIIPHYVHIRVTHEMVLKTPYIANIRYKNSSKWLKIITLSIQSFFYACCYQCHMHLNHFCFYYLLFCYTQSIKNLACGFFKQ